MFVFLSNFLLKEGGRSGGRELGMVGKMKKNLKSLKRIIMHNTIQRQSTFETVLLMMWDFFSGFELTQFSLFKNLEAIIIKQMNSLRCCHYEGEVFQLLMLHGSLLITFFCISLNHRAISPQSNLFHYSHEQFMLLLTTQFGLVTEHQS